MKMKVLFESLKVKKMHNKGFTLAEILISLMIIGILAMLTVPNVVENIQTTIFRERNKNVLYKLSQATDKMEVLGLLETKYASTSDFLDELQNHLAIVKRCKSNELANCFAKDNFTNANQSMNFSDLKTSADVGNSPWASDNEAIVLKDGTSILIGYNAANCEPQKQFSQISYASNLNSNTLNCLSLVYDLNGKGGPNQTSKDIRSLNNAVGNFKLGNIFLSTPFIPDPVPVSDCNSEFLAKYGIERCCSSTSCQTKGDYYAGAVKACQDRGRRLIIASDVRLLGNYLYDLNITFDPLTSGWYNVTLLDKDLKDYFGITNKQLLLWTSYDYSKDGESALSQVLSFNAFAARIEKRDSTAYQAVCVSQ